MSSIEPIAAGPEDAQRLQQLAVDLGAAEAIGLDTEFLRERTYRAQLCLLQLATPERAECVDPLAGQPLDCLKASLSTAGPVKIMHAARQDLEVLWPLFGAVGPIFDTQVAAGLAGMPAQVGYGELVRRLLGVELDKGQTRTDWSRRPLSRAQLVYAIDDVRYLFELRDKLLAQIESLGRTHWLEEELRPLADEASLFVDPEKAVDRLKGISELDPERQRIAQRLAAWRERRAADRNRPRSWILDDNGLRALVLQAPRSQAELAGVADLEAGFIENSGADILREIAALDLPAELQPLAGRSRPDPEFTAKVKQLGTITRDIATALAISPELLATRRDLEQLARGDSQAPPLLGWRREVLGERLLAAL